MVALAIVQEAGEAGDPGQVGGDGRAPLTSPHQDSHTETRPGQPGQHSSASSEFAQTRYLVAPPGVGQVRGRPSEIIYYG